MNRKSSSGDDQHEEYDTIQVYDSQSNSWSVAEDVMPVPRFSFALSCVNNKAYLFAGIKSWDPTFEMLKSVDVFSLSDDGLIAYYPFNGNGNDESGNGNNLTMNPSQYTWTTRAGGQAVSMIGGDFWSRGIQASAANLAYPGTGGFSFGAWVKLESDAFVNPSWPFWVLGQSSPYVSCYDPYFLQISGDGKVVFHIDAGSCSDSREDLQADINSYLGEWFHVFAVYEDADKMLLYINGVKMNEKATDIIPYTSSSYPITIGGILEWTSDDISIDDVRIYNRALSDSEVKALVEMRKAMNLSFSSFKNDNTLKSEIVAFDLTHEGDDNVLSGTFTDSEGISYDFSGRFSNDTFFWETDISSVGKALGKGAATGSRMDGREILQGVERPVMGFLDPREITSPDLSGFWSMTQAYDASGWISANGKTSDHTGFFVHPTGNLDEYQGTFENIRGTQTVTLSVNGNKITWNTQAVDVYQSKGTGTFVEADGFVRVLGTFAGKSLNATDPDGRDLGNFYARFTPDPANQVIVASPGAWVYSNTTFTVPVLRWMWARMFWGVTASKSILIPMWSTSRKPSVELQRSSPAPQPPT